MIDSLPICRVCARRGIAELATWRLDDSAVQNWTLCDHHAQLVGRITYGLRGTLVQLHGAAKIRQQSKENAQ